MENPPDGCRVSLGKSLNIWVGDQSRRISLRIPLIFESGCRPVSGPRRSSASWKVTGHVLECVGTIDRNQIGYWKPTVVASRDRNANRVPVVRTQVVTLTGAEGTIFAGEKYKLRISFPPSYPQSPPSVYFLAPS